MLRSNDPHTLSSLHCAPQIRDLKKELPKYLVAARNCNPIDHADVAEFTEDVLKFWRLNHHKFPAWAKAARIIFSLVASAAASERIFALVKTMFGEEQLSSLADLVQAELMLRKNERAVG